MARVRVATLVMCAFGAVAAVAPSLAAAGSISGVVTDSVGHTGIPGIEVCPTVQPYTFETACAETNASGEYLLAGLAQGAYSVRFSADRHNLDYVNEYFDNKESFPGDLVSIGATEVRTGVNAELHAGGVIAGTVTDAIGKGAVANFPVCAFAQVPTGEVGRCARTDAAGDYAIKGLPEEDYEVAFEGEGDFNYLTQYWEGSETYGTFDPVHVTLGATVADIDAALHVGAEISGTLTEAGTHKPLAGVEVSLLAPVSAEVLRYVKTDAAGRYAFRGRPSGTYVVGFSHTMYGAWNADCYSAQYYQGAADFAAATPLTVVAPSIRAGVDGEVTDICPETGPKPIQVTLLPTPPQPPVLKCRKNFRKKFVRGKRRCVKIHKKRHHHRHRHGPRAVATGH